MSEHPWSFPFDPALPELHVAIDATAMAPRLHERFWRPSDVIRDCRVSRIRYRPGDRCLVQYTVVVGDTEGLVRRHWVSGALYGRPGRASRRAAREGAAFIAAAGMAARLFPGDRKMPHAAALAQAGDARLEDRMRHRFGPGRWDVDEWVAEPVRYREHLSLVVRHVVRARRAGAGERRARTFYVKGYPDAEQPRRAFDRIRHLARHTASRRAGVHVDPPLAVVEDLHALILEESEGRPLDAILRQEPADACDVAVRQAAGAVARLHGSDTPMDRRFTPDEYVLSLNRAVTVLRAACPALGRELDEVRRAVALDARDAACVPVHRDLKPEHLLVTAEHVAMIDLDSCAAAAPGLDLGLMLARFAALEFGLGPRMRDAAQLFLETYRVHAGGRRPRALHLYLAGSLVEVAAGLFHRQKPDWRTHAAALVRRAAEMVSRMRLEDADVQRISEAS